MVGLIYKEFVLQKRSLVILGIVYGLLTIGMFLPAVTDYVDILSGAFDMDKAIFIVLWELVMVFLGFVVITVFQSTVFEVDENKKWAGFISSSPLTGKGQVTAKYGFVLLLSVFVLVWTWITQIIAAVVFQESSGAMDLAINLFYLGLLVHALEFPFIFRFGSKGGKLFQEIFIPVVIYAVVIYVLFGDISAFGSVNEMLDMLFRLLIEGEGIEQIMPIQALIPYITIAAYAVSCWLSGKFYLKGVETYAK